MKKLLVILCFLLPFFLNAQQHVKGTLIVDKDFGLPKYGSVDTAFLFTKANGMVDTLTIRTLNTIIHDRDVIVSYVVSYADSTVIKYSGDTIFMPRTLPTLPDTFYIQPSDHSTLGWIYTGDTLYIDTTIVSSAIGDTFYVKYDTIQRPGMILNGDTIFIDTTGISSNDTIIELHIDTIYSYIIHTDTLIIDGDTITNVRDSVYVKYEEYPLMVSGWVKNDTIPIDTAKLWRQTNNNHLYPANTTSLIFDNSASDSLIKADFINDSVTINGTLRLRDIPILNSLPDPVVFLMPNQKNVISRAVYDSAVIVYDTVVMQWDTTITIIYDSTIYDSIWVYDTIYDTIVVSYDTTIYDSTWVITTIYDTIYDTTYIEEPATFYLAYDTLQRPGWKYSGDTLFVDTTGMTEQNVRDSVYVLYGQNLPKVNGWIKNDTIPIDTIPHIGLMDSIYINYGNFPHAGLADYWASDGDSVLIDTTKYGSVTINGDVYYTDLYWKLDGDSLYPISKDYRIVIGDSVSHYNSHLTLKGNMAVDKDFVLYRDGKYFLHTKSDSTSVYLGSEAGKSLVTKNQNAVVGNNVLSDATQATHNSIVGSMVLDSVGIATENALVGSNIMPFAKGNIGRNSALGSHALEMNELGQNNVAIGYHAGWGSKGSAKLYIESLGTQDTALSLIYGDFFNDSLIINGRFSIAQGLNRYYTFPFIGGTPGQILKLSSNGKTIEWRDDSIHDATSISFWEHSVNGHELYPIEYASDSIGIGMKTPNNLIQVLGFINFNDAKGNTAIGKDALLNTSGINNTALGYNSGKSITTGNNNISVGTNSLMTNTDGSEIIAIGKDAFKVKTTGGDDIAIGYYSGVRATTSSNNTLIGSHTASFSTFSGRSNVAVGSRTLEKISTGITNAAVGAEALNNNTTGNNNVALGYQAGYNNVTGNSNVSLGYMAGYNETTSNKIYIENTSANKFSALLYGDFSADSLILNATVGIGKTGGTGRAYYLPRTLGTANQVLSVPTGTSKVLVWKTPTYSSSGQYWDSIAGGRTLAPRNAAQTKVAIGDSIIPANHGIFYVKNYIKFDISKNNTAVGIGDLGNITTGEANTAVGQGALGHVTTGQNNQAYGNLALAANTTGSHNTGLGDNALQNITISNFNTGVGCNVLPVFMGGTKNVVLGNHSAQQMTSGDSNTIVGVYAGNIITQGSGNIILGTGAVGDTGYSATTSNAFVVDNKSSNKFTSFIYGDLKNDSIFFNSVVGIKAAEVTSPGVPVMSRGYIMPPVKGKPNEVLTYPTTGNILKWKSVSEPDSLYLRPSPTCRDSASFYMVGDTMYYDTCGRGNVVVTYNSYTHILCIDGVCSTIEFEGYWKKILDQPDNFYLSPVEDTSWNISLGASHLGRVARLDIKPKAGESGIYISTTGGGIGMHVEDNTNGGGIFSSSHDNVGISTNSTHNFASYNVSTDSSAVYGEGKVGGEFYGTDYAVRALGKVKITDLPNSISDTYLVDSAGIVKKRVFTPVTFHIIYTCYDSSQFSPTNYWAISGDSVILDSCYSSCGDSISYDSLTHELTICDTTYTITWYDNWVKLTSNGRTWLNPRDNTNWNVGIGVSNPEEKLSVKGDSRFYYTDSGPAMRIVQNTLLPQVRLSPTLWVSDSSIGATWPQTALIESYKVGALNLRANNSSNPNIIALNINTASTVTAIRVGAGMGGAGITSSDYFRVSGTGNTYIKGTTTIKDIPYSLSDTILVDSAGIVKKRVGIIGGGGLQWSDTTGTPRLITNHDLDTLSDNNGIISALPQGDVSITANKHDFIIDSLKYWLIISGCKAENIATSNYRGIGFGGMYMGMEERRGNYLTQYYLANYGNYLITKRGNNVLTSLIQDTTNIDLKADTLDLTLCDTILGLEKYSPDTATITGNGKNEYVAIFNGLHTIDTTAFPLRYEAPDLYVPGQIFATNMHVNGQIMSDVTGTPTITIAPDGVGDLILGNQDGTGKLMIPHLPVLASDTALVKIGNEIGYKVMTSAGLNWSDTLTNLATPYDLTQISGGYWSKLQHHVYTTDASDSVMIGASSSPVGLFEVYNRLRLDDDKYSVYIGNTAGGTYVAANNNVGIGDAALSFLNDGEFNTAIGSNAGGSIIDGIGNTVLGGGALLNGEGNYNTLIGYNALTHDDVAYNNIAIGHNAGGQAHGDTSIYIGRYSGFWNTLNDRFFLNNKQKSNIVGDTTQSMFYGYFNANPALQRLTINAKTYLNGTSQIGTPGINYTLFETDGTQVMTGTATVFEDIIPIFDAGGTTFNYDSLYYVFTADTTTGATRVGFNGNLQLPGSWKEESTIYPKIHYKYQTAQGAPTFVMRYRWFDVNSNATTPFTWVRLSHQSGSTDKNHQVCDGSIDGTGHTINSILQYYIYVLSAVTSGAVPSIPVYQFDITIEKDAIGSRTSTGK